MGGGLSEKEVLRKDATSALAMFGIARRGRGRSLTQPPAIRVGLQACRLPCCAVRTCRGSFCLVTTRYVTCDVPKL